jgi:predicted nucleic acid-binding protein
VALSRFCLDTSAYSHFKRGDQQVVELLDTSEWIGVPSVVIGELWLGFLQSARLDRNVGELNQFLANPVVREIVIDHDVGQLYAEIVLALRRSGTPLPTNDIWIAAAAARYGATVLTYDSHFANIQRVGSIVLSPADESR